MERARDQADECSVDSIPDWKVGYRLLAAIEDAEWPDPEQAQPLVSFAAGESYGTTEYVADSFTACTAEHTYRWCRGDSE